MWRSTNPSSETSKQQQLTIGNKHQHSINRFTTCFYVDDWLVATSQQCWSGIRTDWKRWKYMCLMAIQHLMTRLLWMKPDSALHWWEDFGVACWLTGCCANENNYDVAKWLLWYSIHSTCRGRRNEALSSIEIETIIRVEAVVDRITWMDLYSMFGLEVMWSVCLWATRSNYNFIQFVIHGYIIQAVCFDVTFLTFLCFGWSCENDTQVLAKN